MSDSTKQQQLRILVVVAHPHDFTHCAGTCGIHTKRGDHVTVVSMTDGRTAHDEEYTDELRKPPEERNPAIMNRSIEEYAEKKRNELRLACSYFGITDVRFPHVSEPFRVHSNWQAVLELRDIILEVRPHVVITHSPYISGYYGLHDLPCNIPSDHTETAYAYYEAASLAATPNYHSQVPTHAPMDVYYMGVFASPNQVDFHVDISDWFEQRVKAEAAFTTQGHDKEWAERRMICDIGHQGWFAHTQYAEGFLRSRRELFNALPVRMDQLHLFNSPHLEMMAWMVPGKNAKNPYESK